jgi:WD40 repeat protein
VNGPLSNGGAANGPWFSPERQRLLSAKGTQAQVFDLTTAQAVGRPLPHGGDVLLAAFSLDGRQVVTAGWDRVVRVWDAQTGHPLTPPLLHPRRVLGLAFDGAGQRLVTVGDDNAVRLWDIRSRDQAAPPLSFKSVGDVLALAPGGRAVLALNNGVPRLMEVAGGQPLTPPFGASKATQAVFSPDGQRVAILDAEALRVWDLDAKPHIARVLRPATKVQQFVFSPDGSRVVARLTGNELRVWDAATAAEVTIAKDPADSTWKHLVVSPDGQRFVTIKSKQQVQVWDLATGKLALPAIKHAATVLQAAWSPDGLRLATACADGTVRIWDAKTAEPLTPPLPHGNLLSLVGFSLDGRALVTAGGDGTARVWDATTGQPLTPLWRQGEGVTGVSFSPDGAHLATTSKGGTVRLWDLRADGRPAADLLLLVRILSGQHMHPTSGGFVAFDVGDLRQSWPQLRARFPAEFGHN